MIGIEHRTEIILKTNIKVGDLVKFKYKTGSNLGNKERESYSLITSHIPKIINEDHRHFLTHHFLTENGKFISVDDIVEVINEGGL